MADPQTQTPQGGIFFIDGAINHPKCKCGSDCEFPCWQRYGLTDEPCGACGCGGPEFKSALVERGSDA